MRPRAAALAALAFAAAAASAATNLANPPAAGAASAQQTIAELNAQRTANGLPAGITEQPGWSAACAAHDRYMSLTHELVTTEDPNNPYFSLQGAFAAQNSVLIEQANWDNGDPYDSAPLHLDQLLAPRLQRTGSADAYGFSCTVTHAGWLRPAPAALTVYTYPGPGTTVPRQEVAQEEPWTPGDLVGIPQPATTGPYLIVFVDAPGTSPTGGPATLSEATLTGPSGPVQVRTADGLTSVPSGPSSTLAPYISPGGFIIPMTPLQPATTYHAHVVVTFAGVQTAHDWAFTTEGVDPHSRLSAHGATLSFHSSSPAPIDVTFTRPNGVGSPPVTIASGDQARVRLTPGSWQVCGTQRAAGRYAGYHQCVTIIVTGVPSIHLGPPLEQSGTVQFPLRFSAVLRGRKAKLTITHLSIQCTQAGCSTVAGRPSTRTITLRAAAVSVPRPAPLNGVRVVVSTSAFVLGDQPWAAAQATARFLRH